MHMNRQNLIDNAIYLILRAGQSATLNYPQEYGLHKTAILGDDGYRCSSFDYNKHHFIPRFFYDTVLPILATMLDFPYSKEDFHLNEKIIKYENGDIIDFSFFTPINENFMFSLKYFDIIEKGNGEIAAFLKEKTGGFEILSPVDEVLNANFLERLNGGKFGFYHKLFIGAHNCVRVDNKNLSNGRKIIISTDSHSIPIIPILSCYYETVVALDNRNYINLFDMLTGDIDSAQSLFIMGAQGDYDKWFKQNLQ